MKILFVTSNDNTLVLFDWLCQQEETVLYRDKLSKEVIRQFSPDIIVSYNYKFLITKDVIHLLKGNIINLHISLLPWNRGADPNIWSFIENTPKGVTIHYIDEKIDHGEIIVQKEIFFDEKKETLKSSYEKLHYALQDLFIQNWANIKKAKRKCLVNKENLEAGSFHNKSDLLNYIDKVNFSYDDTIEEFKIKLKNCNTLV